ncbi:UDP-galactose transporter [Flagelloscypha sp. PMI_526]|nr:UDP-galactose transporter [Flagelloscypha sp. PMI_526]
MVSSSSERESKVTEELDQDLTTSSRPGPRGALKEQIASIICYCFASIIMTLVNKFVVSGKDFSMNFLMLAIQASVCILCVILVKALSIISIRRFNIYEAIAWSPVSCFLVLFLYTGSKSMQYLPLPVLTIFKNLTIILIAYGEVIWLNGHVTKLCFTSFLIMVVSSVVAFLSDESVHPSLSASGVALSSNGSASSAVGTGYFWIGANCFISAAYVLTMRIKIKGTGFSDWDTMFYNQLLATPLLFLLSFIAEDWSGNNIVLSFPVGTRMQLLFAIGFSGGAAVGISFATAWCIRVTSSTTYSMVGALNKLPIAVSGIVFFDDPATPGSVSAITIAFCAGVLYAVAKDRQKKEESKEDRSSVVYVPLLRSQPSEDD